MMRKTKAPLALIALALVSGCGIFKGKGNKTPVLGQRVPILVSESSASADPTLAEVQVLVPPAEANADWAQPGGNATKSMGNVALGASPGRAWLAQIAGGTGRTRLAAPPTVADGRVYVMDVAGVVHAYAADTGTPAWQTLIAQGDEKAGVRFGGGVSFEGGRLFATDGLGDVVALNAADGAIVWKAKPGGPLRGSPTLANGQVYVLSQDNQIFALNQADGAVVWTQSGSLESQGVFGVAAPAAGQGTIIAGFSSGELNAYRYENGRPVWQDSLSRTSASTSVSSLADIDASPVVDQGRVFAVGQGGRLVSLEVVTGQRLWEQNFAGISTPWVAGEWLFVVTDDARLVCLARGTGKVRWISQLQRFRKEKSKKDQFNWQGPVLAGGRLVLTNSHGQIVSVSPTDGKVLSTVETKDEIDLPPVVANNTLYLLSEKGRLSAWR